MRPIEGESWQPSLDRLDSTKPYCDGVTVTCWDCNWLFKDMHYSVRALMVARMASAYGGGGRFWLAQENLVAHPSWLRIS